MSNSKQSSLQLLAIFILFLYLLQPASAHNKSHPDGKKKHKSSSSSSGGGVESGQIQVKASLKGSFSQVMAFGDSYTDTGNCIFMKGLKKLFAGSISHSPYGSIFNNPLSGNRFCNGRLVVDFLCEALGLPHLPPYKDPQVNVTFGVNFAVSGSTSLTSDLFSKYNIGQGLLWKSMVPQNFLTQLEWFEEFLEKMAASGQGGKSSSGVGSGQIGGTSGGSSASSGQVGGSASGSFSGSGQTGGSSSRSGSSSGSGSFSGGGGVASSSQIGSSGSSQVGGSGPIGGRGQAGGSAKGSGQISGSGQAGASDKDSGQISGSGQAGGSAKGSGQAGASEGSGQISGSGHASGSASIDLSDVLFWIGEMGVNDYARIISKTALSGNWLSRMSVNQVSKILKALLDKGGKYIVVQGLPPIGCLPLPLSFSQDSDRDKHGCSESINALVKFHNQLLQKTIAEFQAEHKDCIISYADYYSAYITIMTNVTMYQVQEPLKACCGAGSGPFNFSPKLLCGAGSTNKCSDPSKYIVWDGLHLTEAMHSHLADLFFNKGYCHPSIHDMVAKKSKCS